MRSVVREILRNWLSENITVVLVHCFLLTVSVEIKVNDLRWLCFLCFVGMSCRNNHCTAIYRLNSVLNDIKTNIIGSIVIFLILIVDVWRLSTDHDLRWDISSWQYLLMLGTWWLLGNLGLHFFEIDKYFG